MDAINKLKKDLRDNHFVFVFEIIWKAALSFLLLLFLLCFLRTVYYRELFVEFDIMYIEKMGERVAKKIIRNRNLFVTFLRDASRIFTRIGPLVVRAKMTYSYFKCPLWQLTSTWHYYSLFSDSGIYGDVAKSYSTFFKAVI